MKYGLFPTWCSPNLNESQIIFRVKINALNMRTHCGYITKLSCDIFLGKIELKRLHSAPKMAGADDKLGEQPYIACAKKLIPGENTNNFLKIIPYMQLRREFQLP